MTLSERITDYLTKGGLFNPEQMEHDKVRDLLIECREHINAFERVSKGQSELYVEIRKDRDNLKMLIAEKNQTANVFMNQVKKLQAELAILKGEA